jgi:anthranilate/para-aminobenzoate synthase component II
MAIEHMSKPIFGIQYHPESFATEGGKKIISNFLKII